MKNKFFPILILLLSCGNGRKITSNGNYFAQIEINSNEEVFCDSIQNMIDNSVRVSLLDSIYKSYSSTFYSFYKNHGLNLSSKKIKGKISSNEFIVLRDSQGFDNYMVKEYVVKTENGSFIIYKENSIGEIIFVEESVGENPNHVAYFLKSSDEKVKKLICNVLQSETLFFIRKLPLKITIPYEER